MTGYTISEERSVAKEQQFFEYVFGIVQKKKRYTFISTSFEEYYFIILDTIKHYEKLEQYEKCAVLKKELDHYLSTIPKNTEEAIQYMLRISPEDKTESFKNFDEFSFAMELHPTVGKKMIDIWLLRQEISPLKKHYASEHGIQNQDKIAHDVLTKYIQTVKSKIEKK